MVGQNNMLKYFSDSIANDTLPRFIILCGKSGSGKKTLVHEVGKMLNIPTITVGTKVDEIRDMIGLVYTLSEQTLYLIPDADIMSPSAKNSLLKLTEEPPNKAYFIMTIEDVNNTLPTLRSRGTVLHMDHYSVTEIMEYAGALSSLDAEIIGDVCETPGEVDLMKRYGPETFKQYVLKVIDHIASVSDANAFKIGKSVNLKGDDLYDLSMFWKVVIKICGERLTEDVMRYSSCIRITSKYLQDLRITGINKQSTFDMWVMDIRKEWM